MDMDFHSKLSRAKGHNERAKIRAEQKASDEDGWIRGVSIADVWIEDGAFYFLEEGC